MKGVKKAMRDLIVTPKGIFLVGRQVDKSGPNKGQEIETVTRRIDFDALYQVKFKYLLQTLSSKVKIFFGDSIK